MWTRKELKTKAKAVFHTAYWKLVLVGLILSLSTATAGSSAKSSLDSSRGQEASDSVTKSFGTMMVEHPDYIFAIAATIVAIVLVAVIFGILIRVFVFNPLEVGCRKFTVEVRDNADCNISMVGDGFSKNYKNVIKTMFLRNIYVALWSMLFVIPGIIKSYEYRMIPYILAENPEISSKECFELSKRMMDGDKWSAFVLDLSFIGWYILCIFTLGILAIFYVNPYVNQTDAELYDVLKRKVMPTSANSYNDPYMATYTAGY